MCCLYLPCSGHQFKSFDAAVPEVGVNLASNKSRMLRYLSSQGAKSRPPRTIFGGVWNCRPFSEHSACETRTIGEGTWIPPTITKTGGDVNNRMWRVLQIVDSFQGLFLAKIGMVLLIDIPAQRKNLTLIGGP